MKTLAQVIFDNAKPNLSFEEYREVLINSGAFPEVGTLDLPANETVEKSNKKSTKTPRSVNWLGHEVIRGSLKKDTPLSEVVRFLIKVVYERSQRVGGEVNLELIKEWEAKVEPYLDELSLEDAVSVSYEWLKKASSLGEFGSKSMSAYLNTTNKKGGSKSEEETSNFFTDD